MVKRSEKIKKMLQTVFTKSYDLGVVRGNHVV